MSRLPYFPVGAGSESALALSSLKGLAAHRGGGNGYGLPRGRKSVKRSVYGPPTKHIAEYDPSLTELKLNSTVCTNGLFPGIPAYKAPDALAPSFTTFSKVP